MGEDALDVVGPLGRPGLEGRGQGRHREGGALRPVGVRAVGAERDRVRAAAPPDHQRHHGQRHGQHKAVVVVGVLADEVDAAGPAARHLRVAAEPLPEEAAPLAEQLLHAGDVLEHRKVIAVMTITTGCRHLHTVVQTALLDRPIGHNLRLHLGLLTFVDSEQWLVDTG